MANEYSSLNFDEIKALKEYDLECRLMEIEAKGEQDRKTEELKHKFNAEQAELEAKYNKQLQRDKMRQEAALRAFGFICWLTGGCIVAIKDVPEKVRDLAHRESRR